jgi:glycosidase
MDVNQNIYQIYPIGFCGAPKENDGKPEHRILHVLDWIPHMQKLGVTRVLFNPVFESDRHGYDTRDFTKIDCRLGTNEDFKTVCNKLHEAGIGVILDGVFNHVGRGFPFFQDVIEKKWDSPYKDWFYINFNDGWAEDGFTYGNWEGHNELVKLNLDNPDVCRYLLERVDQWIAEFGIDGLRLDVAYCLNQNFIRQLHQHLKSRDPHFFLLGEMIGGDYNVLMREGMLDSVTNYECRKGLFSSMNTQNRFEIG